MIAILVWLVIVGVVIYCVNTLLPIDTRFKRLINVIVMLAVCIWLLEAFGLLPGGLLPPRRLR